jgi:hypothetical protein
MVYVARNGEMRNDTKLQSENLKERAHLKR